MALKNKFPFDKIIGAIEKVVEVAGYLKLILLIFKKDKKSDGK